MLKQAEPKGADFLLNKNPICNPEQTTVRSGEARQSSQAGGVSFNPTLTLIFILILLGIWVLARAQTIPAPAYTTEKNYSNENIANAIYFAEGGKRAKVPYGILSVKVKDKAEARQICINTIRNNRKRFALQTKYTDFIEFLGSRYCPVSAHKLNRYWVGNVKRLLKRQE